MITMMKTNMLVKIKYHKKMMLLNIVELAQVIIHLLELKTVHKIMTHLNQYLLKLKLTILSYNYHIPKLYNPIEQNKIGLSLNKEQEEK